ncbi:MAG: GldG family protein [Clostridia bacterium]|nr:GldG family protein [Clostridia bacterium]
MKKNEKKEKKLLKKMNAEKEKLANKKPFKEKVKIAGKTAKEYFIKDTSKMIILVAILIAVYLVVNLWVTNIPLAQIDLTSGKLHTLTDQSKSIAKNIEKEMTFYLWQYDEGSEVVDLLKQYQAQNDKIKYEIISSDDAEKISKYSLETDYPQIIGIASDGRTSYISSGDLYTYDDSYNVVDLAEQKLTNAIVNLASTESTKVYFVEGRTTYTLSGGIYYLSAYLSEEYYEVDSFNIVSNPTIPEDCDILAIMGIQTDFTEAEANAICDYIEKGGDIIITNDINYVDTTISYPNFQKILDEYAISMPNKLVVDGSEDNQISGYNLVYQAEVASDHEITKVLYNSKSVTPLLVAPGMLELDTERMATENITASPILTTSTESYVADLSGKKLEENEDGYYVTAAAVQKMVESGDESRAVIIASTSSFSDNSLDGEYPIIAYNSDVILNSFAFAGNRGELYSIRKSQSDTPFVATEEKDKVVRIVIYAVPFAIAALGICVWLNRRKLK